MGISLADGDPAAVAHEQHICIPCIRVLAPSLSLCPRLRYRRSQGARSPRSECTTQQSLCVCVCESKARRQQIVVRIGSVDGERTHMHDMRGREGAMMGSDQERDPEHASGREREKRRRNRRSERAREKIWVYVARTESRARETGTGNSGWRERGTRGFT